MSRNSFKFQASLNILKLSQIRHPRQSHAETESHALRQSGRARLVEFGYTKHLSQLRLLPSAGGK